MKMETLEKIANVVNEKMTEPEYTNGWLTLWLDGFVTIHCTRVEINGKIIMFYQNGCYIGNALIESVHRITLHKGVI